MGANLSTRKVLKIGQTVKIRVKTWELQELQQEHGGWATAMVECMCTTGVLVEFDSDGDAIVLYESGNRAVLAGKTTKSPFSVGDIVKITDNIKVAKILQSGREGWTNGMASTLGEVGVVIGVELKTGRVRVTVKDGQSWSYNPLCLLIQKKGLSTAAAKFRETPAQLKTNFDLLEVAETTRKPDTSHFGQIVKVKLTLEEFKSLQTGHGGYADSMAECLFTNGVVVGMDDDGDLKVFYPSGKCWCLNPATVTAVTDLAELFHTMQSSAQLDPQRFGQRVKVDLELKVFKALQENHGGFNDSMVECLTSVGIVLGTDKDGDLKVQYPSGKSWCLNPTAVVMITDDTPEYFGPPRSTETFICPICMDKQINCVFHCGHSVCHICLPGCVAGGFCPVCRTKVSCQTVTKLYI